jgi:hypothetical protein
MRTLLRFLGRLVGFLFVIALLGGFLALAMVFTTLPDAREELSVASLAAPVTVLLDEHGIPRIAARSERDAAVALGYLHARDRMFQMEMMRRSAEGRLAEVERIKARFLSQEGDLEGVTAEQLLARVERYEVVLLDVRPAQEFAAGPLAGGTSLPWGELEHRPRGPPRRQAAAPEFRQPFLYKLVRHPLYTGFFIALWATPAMSVGHALLAGGLSIWMLIAIQLEERDLIALFGDAYESYRRSVGMIIPFLGRRA